MGTSIGPGARLGRYEIDAMMGAGGMGEVYRARDPVLGREVAVKVVMSGAIDADRLARFDHEMRAIASISDSNILAVYDSGVADGVPYLVTELLQGETLRDVLQSGPVPVRKFLSYVTQILRGLEAAHRHGLAHLDLKPENVFVTSQGAIKILDFGIARWIRPSIGTTGDPVETVTAASPVVAGTLGYMAPEQLSGENVDQRADVFAFGVLCYEMLTGRAVFARKTTSETVRAILTEDPPDPPGATVPAAAIGVLRRCVEKNPVERFQMACDVRLALEAVWGADATRDRTTSRLPARMAVVAVLLLTIVAVGIAVYTSTRSEAPDIGPALRLSVAAPVGTSVGLGAAISNGGNLLAMAATDGTGATRLWMRSLTDGNSREFPGTEGATYPFWSPDDGAIGFFAGGKLRVVPTRGGSPRDVCDAPLGRGGTWAGDTILFAPGIGTGLSQARPAGGPVVQTTTPDASRSEVSHRFPSFMPDGRHFTYLAMSKSSGTEGSVMFASIDAPHQPRRLMDSYVAAAWAPDDVLLFVRSGALWAQRFDRATETLQGSPVGIAPAIQLPGVFASPAFSASRTGVLAYQPSLRKSSDLVWRNRHGDVVDTVGLTGEFGTIVLAPDQHAVAVNMVDPQTSRLRVHVFDFVRRVLEPIGQADADSRGAAWSPDSQRLVFASNLLGSNDLYFARVAQPLAHELLVKVGAFDISPDTWSLDGRVLYSAATPDWGVWSFLASASPQPIPVGVGRAWQFDAHLSPTGRWLTFTSEESGRREVMAQLFPEPAHRLQVSANGGQTARWRKDGRELYFISANRQLMAVDVDQQAGRFGVPHALFDTFPGEPVGSVPVYDVSPDGQRFLMVRPPPDASASATTVIVNWPSLLRR